MTNGFYNSNELTKTLKRKFIKDAINLSYHITCESKYSRGAPFKWRGIDRRLTLSSSLDWLFNDKTAKLDCIDRFPQNKGELDKELCEYEICFHTTNGPRNGWLLVYIFVNENCFNTLIEKYNLKLIKW